MKESKEMITAGHLGGYIDGPVGDEATFYPDLWRWFKEEVGIRSVLDVGCGSGVAVKYFGDTLGLKVRGVDGIAQPDRRIKRHDFTKGPFIPYEFFDLGYSTEFVEHVEGDYMVNYLASLRRCRMVALTFAIPGQQGYHHVHCQPEEFWLGALAAHGFLLDKELTTVGRAIAAKNTSPYNHFAQRGLIFCATQKCSNCNQLKTPDEFWRREKSWIALQPECKECNRLRNKQWRMQNPRAARARHLKQKYNITEEQFASILASQKGKCPVCEKEILPDEGHVDHDHETGLIRGILHGKCNRGLGMLLQTENCERAALYLKSK